MSKRRWKNPDKRMEAVVRYRQAGLSLRQIGDRLAVSYQTVARDLARFEDQQVSHLLSHLALSETSDVTGDVTP